jgi:hypothetical protein
MFRDRGKQGKKGHDVYDLQNRLIHAGRAQIGMSLEDCRELAREIGGRASLSSLSIDGRWLLIEALKVRGADIETPSPEGGEPEAASFYDRRVEFWNGRFPKDRPGYASNKQLALIETLWFLDFQDGRVEPKRGLRGFIFRQTQGLANGPVSDPAFLRSHHVDAVMTPLKAKSKEKQELKKWRGK